MKEKDKKTNDLAHLIRTHSSNALHSSKSSQPCFTQLNKRSAEINCVTEHMRMICLLTSE